MDDYPKLKKRIIFYGDSLTEYGSYPGGYISLLRESLAGKDYELIGAGVGGDKIYDLYLRLEEILSQQPDVVFILIGINDIWHKTSGIGTDAKKFRRFYEAIIQKLLTNNIEVILATPTLIGEMKDFKNPQDDDLEYYSQIVREIAAIFNCQLIDLHKVFTDYIQTHNSDNKSYGILTIDKVHLNNTGNQLVSDTITSIF